MINKLLLKRPLRLASIATAICFLLTISSVIIITSFLITRPSLASRQHVVHNQHAQDSHNISETTTAVTKQLSDILTVVYNVNPPTVKVATGGPNQSNSPSSLLYDDHMISSERVNSKLDQTTLSSSMLKTYIRSNNMRAYHMDLHSYRPEAKYAGDPAFVDSENPEHKRKCWRHLQHFNQLLKAFYESDPVLSKNSLDSIRLADSFGRPEAGLLRGSQFWLGDQESCSEYTTSLEAEPIKGHYCLGVAQYPNWNPSDSKTSIKIGLCLPESCTNSMLNDESKLFDTVQSMMKYQIVGLGEQQTTSRGPFGKLTLREVYCLPHETSQVRQYSLSGVCFLAVVGSFLVGCITATTIDLRERAKIVEEDKETLKGQEKEQKSTRTIFVESFSLARNIEKFFHVRDDPPPSKEEIKRTEPLSFNRATFFKSITGLKCIGLCWIIAAHTFLVSPIPSKNIIGADKLTKTYLADFYLTAHLMVDTFFCLSGILAAYLIFREGIHKIQLKHWVVMTVHRYWRLAPIYLLCYWYTKSVGHLLSSGPLWDYATSEVSPRLNCQRESWWTAILMMSDFKSPKEHCVPFAWFIGNGIKFWIITPIFLILIHKSIKKGYMFACTTILANIILVASLAMRSTVDMKSVIEFKPESADNMLNDMGEIYTRPYSRIGAYLIGLLAGHLMYMVDTNQLRVRISPNANTIIWSLCSIVVLILTFMLKLASSLKLDDSAIPIVFGICSALIRPLWALCTCWLVFALARGQAAGLASFLSSKFWRILVKISFCGYLAQGEVIAQLYLSTPVSNSYTYVDMIVKPIETIVLTILVSFVMVLTLEYPLVGIEQLILPKHRDSNSKAKQEEAEEASSEKRIVNQEQIVEHKSIAELKGEKVKTC